MEKEDLETQIGKVLEEKKTTDIFGVLPPEITEQLRGKILGLSGDQVLIEDTLATAEQRASEQGWQRVRFIQGPPLEDISLKELEGRI